MVSAVILDVDGTLVDSNYHHAIAWDRAFAQHEVPVPLWRIHRTIGMGGDQLVRELAGDEVEDRDGEQIRSAQSERYGELISEVRVINGAKELIRELERRGVSVVLASSSGSDEVEHYVELLEAADLAEWTTSSDVDKTKPEPDLVEAALEKAGTRDAVMIGDTIWDVEAAKRAGIETQAVLTGGVSEAELRQAGAVAIYESVVELKADLDNALSR